MGYPRLRGSFADLRAEWVLRMSSRVKFFLMLSWEKKKKKYIYICMLSAELATQDEINAIYFGDNTNHKR